MLHRVGRCGGPVREIELHRLDDAGMRRAKSMAHKLEQSMRRRDILKTASVGALALAAPRLALGADTATLRFVPQADLAVLDPVFTTAYVTRNHAFMVFDTLYGIDEAFNPQPQMLAGHTVENDGKLWTLTLREGLKFHDGEPVLAKDALASIKRWAPRDAFGSSLLAATEEMTAPSDREVQIRLKKPFPMLPLAMGHGSNTMLPVMPERLANTPASQAVTEMVGSGPYRFVANERVAGSLAVYRKFDGYVPRADGKPSFTTGPKVAHVERIEWHTIPDPATAAAALQAGEIDWWEQPTSDLLPLLRKNKAIVTEILDRAGNIGFLRINSLLPPFDNPAIKHALLGAINQADFMQAVVGDDPAMWHDKVGVFTPGTPLATDAGHRGVSGHAGLRPGEAGPGRGGLQGREGHLHRRDRLPRDQCAVRSQRRHVPQGGDQPRLPGARLGHGHPAPQHPGTAGAGRVERALHLHGRLRPDEPGDQSVAERNRAGRVRRLADRSEAGGAADRVVRCARPGGAAGDLPRYPATVLAGPAIYPARSVLPGHRLSQYGQRRTARVVHSVLERAEGVKLCCRSRAVVARVSETPSAACAPSPGCRRAPGCG